MYALPKFPLAASWPPHFSDLCCAGPPSISVRVLVRLSNPGQFQWYDPHCQPTTASSAFSFTPSPKVIPVVCPDPFMLAHLPDNAHFSPLPASACSPSCLSESHLHAAVWPSTLPLTPCTSPITPPSQPVGRDDGLGTRAPFLISSSPWVSPGQCSQPRSFQASAGSKQTPLSDQRATPGPVSLDTLKPLTNYVCTPNQVSASSSHTPTFSDTDV